MKRPIQILTLLLFITVMGWMTWESWILPRRCERWKAQLNSTDSRQRDMAKAALKRAGEAAVICMLSYLPKGTREQRLITRDLIVNLGERGLDYVRIALKHRDWRVREMAVMALVQLPIAEDRRIAKLQQMLLDDDPFVRYEVIKGLGVFGERSKAVLARMVNLLQEGRAAPKPPPGPGGSLEDVHGPWGAWKPSEEDQTNIKIDDPERSLHSVMRDLRDKISDISDDIDRDVRRAVVQELAKIELDAAVVTRHLLAALKDRDQFVRKDAEHEIRQLSIRAVPTLIAEIQLPTSDQRFIAAELLGDIGQPALSEIAKLLTSLDQTVWRASLRALQRMGSQASALVPLLCNQLSMSSEIQARDLTETLSEIGISAFSCLRQLVAHPQSSFRSIALYGLSRMVSRHTKYANLPLITEIIVFLRRGLEDKDLTVQSEAIWGIGQIGQQIRCDNPLSPKSSGTSLPNSNPASTQGSAQTTACRYAQFTMDLLPSLLVHPCRNLTQCMSILFRTWVNIAPAHPQVIAQLQQLLDRGSDLQRIAVLRTLVQITPLDLALQELALSHFQSDNPKLRMAALDALSAHPHQLRSSLSSLQKLLFSDHVEVQITTVWLIARVGSQAKLGTALIEPLSRLLLHTTPRIQHAAIEALYHSQIRPNNKLQTILLQLLGHSEWRVRVITAQMFSLVSPPTKVQLEALTKALRDPIWRVRLRAVETLGKWQKHSYPAQRDIRLLFTDSSLAVVLAAKSAYVQIVPKPEQSSKKYLSTDEATNLGSYRFKQGPTK